MVEIVCRWLVCGLIVLLLVLDQLHFLQRVGSLLVKEGMEDGGVVLAFFKEMEVLPSCSGVSLVLVVT